MFNALNPWYASEIAPPIEIVWWSRYDQMPWMFQNTVKRHCPLETMLFKSVNLIIFTLASYLTGILAKDFSPEIEKAVEEGRKAGDATARILRERERPQAYKAYNIVDPKTIFDYDYLNPLIHAPQ